MARFNSSRCAAPNRRRALSVEPLEQRCLLAGLDSGALVTVQGDAYEQGQLIAKIEDAFFEHPKVAMAAVIGLPREEDPSNEYVKAYIVLKEGETATEDEFIAFAKENMAGYKRPREVVFVDSLPMSAVGKVLRRELKEAELAKK